MGYTKKLYGGHETFKKINVGKEIAGFFSRLVMFTNQMKSCREKITKVQRVKKSPEKVRKQALHTKFFKKIKEDSSNISRGKEKLKKKLHGDSANKNSKSQGEINTMRPLIISNSRRSHI